MWNTKKLNYKVKTWIITCETWLHIWGNKWGWIWEVDNPVIKNPVNNLPYIPWSSIKWKIRSLLEITYWKISKDNKWNGTPYTWDDLKEKFDEKWDLICKWFGSHLWKYSDSWITRFLFRDANMLWTEIKYENKFENIIDRNKWITINGWLRESERVPEWTKFNFEIVIRYFNDEEFDKLNELLEEWILLLEKDYLWWSWSRWYWKISFKFN
jgi:CRISPR-associated protein Csm3